MNYTVENLYIIQNANGTLDMMRCGDPRLVRELWETIGLMYGGVTDLVKVSVLVEFDLAADELEFDFVQSNN